MPGVWGRHRISVNNFKKLFEIAKWWLFAQTKPSKFSGHSDCVTIQYYLVYNLAMEFFDQDVHFSDWPFAIQVLTNVYRVSISKQVKNCNQKNWAISLFILSLTVCKIYRLRQAELFITGNWLLQDFYGRFYTIIQGTMAQWLRVVQRI